MKRVGLIAVAVVVLLCSASAGGAAERSGAERSTVACNLRWRVVRSPANLHGFIRALAAVSSSDVWAVGIEQGTDLNLVLHFDGHRWARVPAPSPQYAQLNAVAAVGRDDVWAVGSFGATNSRALALHWDGR